jgi:outer membrane lipoprotein SlyB
LGKPATWTASVDAPMCEGVRKFAHFGNNIIDGGNRSNDGARVPGPMLCIEETGMNAFSAMTRTLVALACGLLAAGCATTGANNRQSSAGYADYGTIQSIEQLSGGGGSTVAGTLVGAAVGGVVGHQFGGGSGKDLATVAGAVGGAIVGHEIQQRAQERDAAQNDYRITVRMRDGSRRTFTDNYAGNLHVGQEVRIVGDRIQF